MRSTRLYMKRGAVASLLVALASCASSSDRPPPPRSDPRPGAAPVESCLTVRVGPSPTKPRPAIAGTVARVASDVVWISVGRRDGVRGGDTFVVLRKERPIGIALVENLWEGGCTARGTFLEGCSAAPGDRVVLDDRERPARVEGGVSPKLASRGGVITVDFEDVDLRDAMRRISGIVGARIDVDPTVNERVTISFVGIPWRDAVDVIARMAKCEVEERPDRLVLQQP